MKVYEIGIVDRTDPIWIETDCILTMALDSDDVEYIREINVNPGMPGVDMVIKSPNFDALLGACKHVRDNLKQESKEVWEHEIAHLEYAIEKAEGEG